MAVVPEHEPGKIFVGGLNWITTKDSLEKHFSQYGEVSESTVMTDAKDNFRPRGFGFVHFKRDEDVEVALAVEEHLIDGKKVDPKRATNAATSKSNLRSKIFVGGIPHTAENEHLHEAFSQFGEIAHNGIEIKMDTATKKPRGFGFVTFEDEDAAVKAVTKQFLEILGKRVEVKAAENAKPKGPSQGQGAYSGPMYPTANGQAYESRAHSQQPRGGQYNYAAYSPSPGFYPQHQQYGYHQAPYSNSSGAGGYNMHAQTANGHGQSMNYADYGYSNTRDTGAFHAAHQQQFPGYHQQQAYGGTQAGLQQQGYGRSQQQYNYTVHQ